jgi:hypothetical protein
VAHAGVGGAASTVARWLRAERDAARGWCAGRTWTWRAPVLLWMAWIGGRQFLDAEYESLFGLLNLGIHELGHPLLGCCGTFLGVAGGTIAQCAVPLGSMAMFRRQPDWFAIAVCGGWFGTNCHGVARYCADARAGQLQLFSPFGGGGHVVHDWEYLLETLGLLHWDGALAAAWRGAAHLSSVAGLAFGGWLLWQMARGGAPPPVPRAVLRPGGPPRPTGSRA